MRTFLALLIIGFLFCGCSKDTDITIYNDTPYRFEAVVDGEIIQLSKDQSFCKNYILNYLPLASETKDVKIEVRESRYIEAYTRNIELRANEDESHHVKLTRSVLSIQNQAAYTIKAVKCYDESKKEWSENLITRDYLPETVFEIYVSPTNSTLKFTNNASEESIYEYEIDFGETKTLIYNQ
jgi:hypothetical protein